MTSLRIPSHSKSQINKAGEIVAEGKIDSIGYAGALHMINAVHHMHLHLIPRYIGDVENPQGGVRHLILGKGNY